MPLKGPNIVLFLLFMICFCRCWKDDWEGYVPLIDVVCSRTSVWHREPWDSETRVNNVGWRTFHKDCTCRDERLKNNNKNFKLHWPKNTKGNGNYMNSQYRWELFDLTRLKKTQTLILLYYTIVIIIFSDTQGASDIFWHKKFNIDVFECSIRLFFCRFRE